MPPQKGRHPFFSLVILCANLKVALRMAAGWADFRCLFADNDVAAVSAFPNFNRTLGKHLCCLHIMKQCPIALLMMLFNGRNQTESGTY